MRIVSALLFVLLIVFAAVQYNDPDGIYWPSCRQARCPWQRLGVLDAYRRVAVVGCWDHLVLATNSGVLAARRLVGHRRSAGGHGNDDRIRRAPDCVAGHQTPASGDLITPQR